MGRSSTLVRGVLLTSAVISATEVLGQQVDADIDLQLNGTYELTYGFANGSASPYVNGDVLTFVIDGTADTLCVDGKLLASPYYRNSTGVEALWKDADLGAYYGLSVRADTGAFNEINVYAPSDGGNDWVGQFFGSKVSDGTDCAGASSPPASGTYTENGVTISADEKKILDIAERVYPGLFKQGSTLKLYQDYAYRYYAGSKLYVGFKDGTIFLRGAQFGNNITQYGVVSSVLSNLEAKAGQLNIDISDLEPVVGSDVTDALTGDYTLTITGSYDSGLISIDIPPIVFNNIAAPSPSDTDEIVDALESLELNIDESSIVVQVLNNTSSRVTFTVELTATVDVIGDVTYTLNYDYVK